MTAKVTPAFTAAYKKLNPAQKQAVDTIEGPVLVVAGPGTGKTQILSLRIGNILKETDTPPDAILALTFTEAGVRAMRERLLSLIGPASYRVKIHTFHSFCNAIIQSHPHYFPSIVGAQPLTDIDAITIVRKIIDETTLDKLKLFGDPYYYVQKILGAITDLKREKVSADMLSVRVTKEIQTITDDPESYHTTGRWAGQMKGEKKETLERLSKTKELALVFAAYEAALSAQRKYDFQDMILEVVDAFTKNADFLQMIQEEYLYILADEHQDANTAQNALLMLLTNYHDNPNLFLVGDEKQAIFSFQGASLEHFATFTNVFPQAITIDLTVNYRSGQKILDASHEVMKNGSVTPERNIALSAHTSEPSSLEVASFPTEEIELAWVSEQIQNLLSEGVASREIAVLYRNNKDAVAIAESLQRLQIPSTIESKENVLSVHTIRQLISYMRTAVFYGDEVPLVDVLHAPWNHVHSEDLYRIVHVSRREHQSMFATLEALQTTTHASFKDPESLKQLHITLLQLAATARKVHARDFLNAVLHESGFMTYMLASPDSARLLASVRGLAATLEKLSQHRNDYSPAAFLNDIELFEKYGLQIESDTVFEHARGVRLMTIHGAKGLEFEHVFMVHVRDGKWGNVRDQSSFYVPGLERVRADDERRLFYVALTRAKRSATLSYGLETAEGTNVLPSQFIAELGDHVTPISTDEYVSTYAPERIFMRPQQHVSEDEMEYLRTTFMEQGLSVTALNNFLVCPWRYFYRNLVRIPEPLQKHLLFGNAIHACIQAHFETYRSTGVLPSLDTLLARIPVHFEKQGFWKKDLQEAMDKAHEALTGWYEARSPEWVSTCRSEVPFELRVTLESEIVPSLLIRGKIDRIDHLPDGTLCVVDYKSGKPKSRNVILGKTKSSEGEYYRQLTFYKLLLSESHSDPLREAMIDFLEPNDRGVYKSESFSADELDVPTLAKELTAAAESIYMLDFWNSRCDDRSCEYCKLRDSLE